MKIIDGEIRHYVDVLNDLPSDTHVTLSLDKERRLINSRYHTAAHFLSTIVEKTYPHINSVKGHQFPNEAYVEFNLELPEPEIFIEKINHAMDAAITNGIHISTKMINPREFEELFKNLPYEIPMDKPLRSVMIDDLPIPCGGTHAKSAQELGKVKITKIKKNRANYTVED